LSIIAAIAGNSGVQTAENNRPVVTAKKSASRRAFFSIGLSGKTTERLVLTNGT
jgi:hypothetical protein